MKRIAQATLTLALVAALGTLFADTASAQDKAPGQNPDNPSFVDADGDGVCDNFTANGGQGMRQGKARGKKMGPADGTGNKGQGPKDGTGYGAMKNVTVEGSTGTGTGTCDGTGPKGNQSRQGRR